MRDLFYRLLAFLFPNTYQYGPVEEALPISQKNNYSQRKLLTPTEISFYIKIKKLETLGDYLVFPQINLATIISKNSKYRNELFRNVDFGIFNSSFDLLLLIELNDKTHKQYKRHKRDMKVREICENANIKLITFYTSYPNEESYVINRILKEINLPKEETDSNIKTQND